MKTAGEGIIVPRMELFPAWCVVCPIVPQRQEHKMADSGGGTGILGVLVGVMLVIFVGAAVLMATGQFGAPAKTLTIKMP